MPDAGLAPSIYTATPKLLVNNEEQPAMGELLKSMVIEDSADGMSRFEATFVNWGPGNGGNDFQFFDGQMVDFGKVITVQLGSGLAAGTVFEGRITGLEARYPREVPPEVLLLAEDRLQDLRMTRRTRTFESITDADLFRQVVAPYGLQTDIDLSGPTHRVLAQLNQSDLAFLRDRARAVDAEVWVEGTTLKAKSRTKRPTGDVTLTYKQALMELALLVDVSSQATACTVSGWDPSGKEMVSYKADDAALGSELNGFKSGGSILKQSFGKRDQQIVHQLPVTSQEAQALAEGAFRRAARRFVTGKGITECDARVRVGATVQLSELGNPFNGKYYVARVRHTFDQMEGSKTAFWVERAGIGQG